MKRLILFFIFSAIIYQSPLGLCSTFKYKYRKVSSVDVKPSSEDAKQYDILKKAFDEKNNKNNSAALKKLIEWKPSLPDLAVYKNFWTTIWSEQEGDMWSLYQNLKKDKKHIRLRLEIYKALLEKTDLKDVSQAKKEARALLKFLKGTSEGELLETQYLRWLQKNKFYDEVCSTERRRWINQPDIDYVEMTAGIEKCPIALDDFLSRMRRLLFSAKEFQAQREIDIYLKSQTNGLKDYEKVYIQAIYNSHRGEPDTAFKALQKYEKELIGTDLGENYFYIAQRAGYLDEAEKIIDLLVGRKDIKVSQKNEWLFQKGLLFYQNGKYPQALDIISKLQKTHSAHLKKKKNKNYEQLAWLSSWINYLMGNYSEALKGFDTMKDYTTDKNRLAYWMAMSYMKIHEELTALQIFKKLAEPINNNKSYSYYNLLGWIRHSELKKTNDNNEVMQVLYAMTKDKQAHFPVISEDFSKSRMLDLYIQILDQPINLDEEQINVVNTENDVIYSEENAGIEVKSEDELLKNFVWAQFLVENKKEELAKWHLYELEKNLKDKLKIYELADFYLKSQFYYRALSLVQRAAFMLNENVSFDSSNLALNALYPEAYKDITFKQADKRNINPYFLLSLMRAETQYKPDAISPVGAIGLMQFMPYTQEKVSDLIGLPIQNEDLFKPEMAIKFGAAYIKKLSVEFNKLEPLMAAGYNGGPHRVKSWIKKTGSIDFDVFIEKIPFAETRTYVKRVLAYKSIYEKIYNKDYKAESLNYLIKPFDLKLDNPLSLKEEWEPFKRAVQRSN